ncbi:hypothetical protein YC2023_118968 [Brassica napus]
MSLIVLSLPTDRLLLSKMFSNSRFYINKRTKKPNGQQKKEEIEKEVWESILKQFAYLGLYLDKHQGMSNSHGGSRRFSVSNICIKSLCWFPSCRSVSDSTPMIRYMIKWLIVIYGHLGPTPSHSILRNSLQVGETLPIKRHNVKRGGELIGVDMLLLDSKATLMPGSSPSHHLQTALKGGFYAALMSLVNRTGFLNSRRTLQVSKSKSAAWPSQHKYPASSDVSGTLSMFDSDAVSFHSHLDG